MCCDLEKVFRGCLSNTTPESNHPDRTPWRYVGLYLLKIQVRVLVVQLDGLCLCSRFGEKGRNNDVPSIRSVTERILPTKVGSRRYSRCFNVSRPTIDRSRRVTYQEVDDRARLFDRHNVLGLII